VGGLHCTEEARLEEPTVVFFVVEDPDEEPDIPRLVAIARTIAHTALEDLHRLGVDHGKAVVGCLLGGIVHCRALYLGCKYWFSIELYLIM